MGKKIAAFGGCRASGLDSTKEVVALDSHSPDWYHKPCS
jgi:hypothetical protein